MKWIQIPLGPLQTNGYVLYKESGSALIVDPGGEEHKLIDLIEQEKLSLKGILLTHAHFDHIGGVEGLRNACKAPVFIHKNEAEWLMDPKLNGSSRFLGNVAIKGKAAEVLLSEEGVLEIEDWEVEVLMTPGHSPGSVSYYFPKEGLIFSGDVLFHGGVGRTDLPGGDQDLLMKTLHDKMLTLPDETIVANGHGPTTTIGKEKQINPFINSFGW